MRTTTRRAATAMIGLALATGVGASGAAATTARAGIDPAELALFMHRARSAHTPSAPRFTATVNLDVLLAARQWARSAHAQAAPTGRASINLDVLLAARQRARPRTS
jgi:hypothetical protein